MNKPKDDLQYKNAYTRIMLDNLNSESSAVNPTVPSEALKHRVEELINNKTKKKAIFRTKPSYLLAAVVSIASALFIFVIFSINKKEAEFPVLHVECENLQSQSIEERLLNNEYAIGEVPDGFIPEDTVCSDAMLQHTYTNKTGASIILTQIASAYYKLDRQYTMETITTTRGDMINVYLLIEKSNSDAYWIDNGYLFNLRTVDCSFDKASIYKIIKSIIQVS